MTAIALLLLYAIIPDVRAAEFPALTVPNSIGVCIQFNGSAPDYAKQLDMIQAAGIGVVRADFLWQEIETEKGQYSFSAFDNLVDDCKDRNIRVMALLCYGNTLYDVPYGSQEYRDPFAAFVRATVQHFKGRNFTWELWNEPNNPLFWEPVDANQYMALANQVLPAIREVDPTATIVAPAVCPLPNWNGMLDYLTTCFNYGSTHPGQKGLLQMIDAVTVHPYRGQSPESVINPTYDTLDTIRSRMIAAGGGSTAILLGEWGYSVGEIGSDEPITPQRQGDYCARMQLVSISQGLPFAIWYDWKDDGDYPEERECNFGLVDHRGVPKPAYHSMKDLTYALRGKTYAGRLSDGNPNDWLLLFKSADGQAALAAWTIEGDDHIADVPGWGRLHLSGTPVYVNDSRQQTGGPAIDADGH